MSAGQVGDDELGGLPQFKDHHINTDRQLGDSTKKEVEVEVQKAK